MASVQLGARANGSQVSLLLLIVVFIGAVIGVERSVLPLLATSEFSIVSATVTIRFLVAFGFANAGREFPCRRPCQSHRTATHSLGRVGFWYSGPPPAHVGSSQAGRGRRVSFLSRS